MSSNPYNAPAQDRLEPMQSAGIRSVVVKKIGILSFGIVSAAMCAIIALLYGFVMFLSVFIVDAAGGRGGMGGGLIFGVIGIIIGPLVSGVFGFIFGIIGAFIYNLFAGIAGGIRMDLES